MIYHSARTVEPAKLFDFTSFIGSRYGRKTRIGNVGLSSNIQLTLGRTPSTKTVKSDISLETVGIAPYSIAEQIVTEALAWASIHGVIIGNAAIENSGKIPGVGLVHAPICLLPSPFLGIHFQHALELAPLFNELIDRVSLDDDFLQETLCRTRKTDNFTAKLLDIHSTIKMEGNKQAVRLGLHRSDYMVDTISDTLLQIEINTISSSFSGLGSQVTQLHRYILERIQNDCGLHPSNIPNNQAADGFAKAISLAFNEFGEPSAVVLMVVQPGERNMYDQYWLSTKIIAQYGIPVIRKTLGQVYNEGVLCKDGSFFIGSQKIAVVYYRAGYDPKDYPSENEWTARISLEKSNAIKCPSITYHLAGTKKVQQELAKSNVLERFVDDGDAVSKLRRCFAGLWGLDDGSKSEIINQATSKPDAFVLKPQREGGGNNLFGEEMKKKLLELMKGQTDDSFSAYILMQRIFPPIHTAYMLRDGKMHVQEAVSELGIFATYLRNKEKVILNEHSGYLLRTKASNSNEGGVAAGFAFLDSVYLV